MGDFQDVFGAGADAVSIIDGICRAEDRYEREERLAEEIIEHRIWFSDYASAERWEKEHQSWMFTRRRCHKGYEVTVKARRDAKRELRNKELDGDNILKGKRVKILFAENLRGHEISCGGFRVRLAERTTPELVDFISHLRGKLPAGLANVSPLCLPLKEVRGAFKGMTEHLSYNFELPDKIIAIHTSEHRIITGRRVGDDVMIWPWELEMDCGGGNASPDGSPGCFLCSHNAHIELQAYSGALNGLWEAMDPDSSHFVRRIHYENMENPVGLAHCLSAWIDLLSSFDTKLGEVFQSPLGTYLCRAGHPEEQKLKTWCTLLARSLAAVQSEECDVSVSCRLSGGANSLPQFEPDTLEFLAESADDDLFTSPVKSSFTKALNGYKQKVEVPGLKDELFQTRLEWLSAVEFVSTGEKETPLSRLFRDDLYKGSYSTDGMSAHEKIEAVQVASDLVKLDMAEGAKQFMERHFVSRE